MLLTKGRALVFMLGLFGIALILIVVARVGLIPTIVQPSVRSLGQSLPVIQFLEKQPDFSFPGQLGKIFCNATVVWEKNISSDEKVVYVLGGCMHYLLRDGDLRFDGGGEAPPLYLLKNIQGSWIVEDDDDRWLTSFQESSKYWVRKYDAMVPSYIKSRQFILLPSESTSTVGTLQEAAAYYGIVLPKHTFNTCLTDLDCAGGQVCDQHGVDNIGPSVCVTRCSTNRECGIASVCMEACVHGENGCPSSIVDICENAAVPNDLYKDPNGTYGSLQLEAPTTTR